MEPIQAVHEGHPDTVFSQDGGEGEKSQGSCPEIKGCKDVDPWIDAQYVGSFGSSISQSNAWMFF